MQLYGREPELEKLQSLREKFTASLVCVLGRRRIGKSYLIQYFGKSFKTYFEVQGLGPHSKNHSKIQQLAHFAYELSEKFNIKKPYFEDWDEAFEKLAELTKIGETLILLDEISWMAKGDELFSAKLKAAWDAKFKKNQKLILVICGSVSAWIEENILKDTNFEGRLSLEINLKELSLPSCNQFLSKSTGDFEKMIALSITGGVPKYLEEIRHSIPITQSMAQLCFSESGILFNDFQKIFLDIFQRKSKTYEKIIRAAMDKKLSPMELAHKTKIEYNSDFLKALKTLELSGFLSRDYYFNPLKKEVSKFSHIRVKDNYLKFYLKVIEPLKENIVSGGLEIYDLKTLNNLDALLGYQFENLILSNRMLVHKTLKIDHSDLIASAPHIQKKTTQNRGGCQIDLLVQTKMDVFYLCEFKCQRKISKKIITHVQKKIELIKIPKRASIKPVLIYIGEIDPDELSSFKNYFYKMIYFGDLLKMN